MVLCGVRTFVRNADWHDDLRLWTATARTAPDSFKSHDSLAEALYQADPAHDNIRSRDRGKRKEPRDPAGVIGPGRPATAVPRRRKLLPGTMATGCKCTRPTSSDVAKAYRTSGRIGRSVTWLSPPHIRSPARDISDAQLLVSTAYNHLDQSQRALDVRSARRCRPTVQSRRLPGHHGGAAEREPT